MSDRKSGLCGWFLPSSAGFIFICNFLNLSLVRGGELLNDADTGYHIRAGDYILQTGTIPQHDIFSFITPALPWTAHEWGSEVIMALVHDFGGLTGVVVFFSFLIALTFALLLKTVTAQCQNVLVAMFVVVLAQGASTSHWLARPHIFTLLLACLLYYLVDLYEHQGVNRLFLLPFIMVFWVNLHGGFIVAFIILTAYLAGNALQLVHRHQAGEELDFTKVKTYAAVILGCLAAALVNPFGGHILLFPFELLGNKFIIDGVPEFLSPNFHEPIVFKYLFLLLLAAFLLTRKAANAVETILVLLFTNMALYSVRHIPLFAIVTAPILARRLDSAVSGSGEFCTALRRKAELFSSMDAGSRGIFLPLVSILLVVVLVGNRQVSYSFDPRLKPVAAMKFLQQEKVNGRMFNSDEIGDYVIYSCWPQYRVFVDGRLDMYGTARLKDYVKVKDFLPGWEKVLDSYGIDVIVFDADAALSRYLMHHRGWKAIYRDGVANVFVRDKAQFRGVIERHRRVWCGSQL